MADLCHGSKSTARNAEAPAHEDGNVPGSHNVDALLPACYYCPEQTSMHQQGPVLLINERRALMLQNSVLQSHASRGRRYSNVMEPEPALMAIL